MRKEPSRLHPLRRPAGPQARAAGAPAGRAGGWARDRSGDAGFWGEEVSLLLCCFKNPKIQLQEHPSVAPLTSEKSLTRQVLPEGLLCAWHVGSSSDY